MIWIGSRIGLGAPVLLTDRSEKEKRSRLGGSSFGTGRGWSVAVSVSWTLNSFGSIVEVVVSASYHWQGLIPWSYWYLIASRSFSSYVASAPVFFSVSRAALSRNSGSLQNTLRTTRSSASSFFFSIVTFSIVGWGFSVSSFFLSSSGSCSFLGKR